MSAVAGCRAWSTSTRAAYPCQAPQQQWTRRAACSAAGARGWAWRQWPVQQPAPLLQLQRRQRQQTVVVAAAARWRARAAARRVRAVHTTGWEGRERGVWIVFCTNMGWIYCAKFCDHSLFMRECVWVLQPADTSLNSGHKNPAGQCSAMCTTNPKVPGLAAFLVIQRGREFRSYLPLEISGDKCPRPATG